ncbi:MAG: hypothetical protein ACQET1_10585 [Gemmatimonadota bacterium]
MGLLPEGRRNRGPAPYDGKPGRRQGEEVSAHIHAAASPVRTLVLLAGLGQILGFTLYFYTMWSRIRSVGSRAREAEGERF